MSMTWMGGGYDEGTFSDDYPKSTYNDNGKLEITDYENGHWKAYAYDGKGNKILMHDANGFWERWLYSEQGDLMDYDNSLNHWYEYRYKESIPRKISLIESYYDSPGNYMNFTYDDDDHLIGYEDSKGQWIKYVPGESYEDFNGNYWTKSMGIEMPYDPLTKTLTNLILIERIMEGHPNGFSKIRNNKSI